MNFTGIMGCCLAPTDNSLKLFSRLLFLLKRISVYKSVCLCDEFLLFGEDVLIITHKFSNCKSIIRMI